MNQSITHCGHSKKPLEWQVHPSLWIECRLYSSYKQVRYYQEGLKGIFQCHCGICIWRSHLLGSQKKWQMTAWKSTVYISLRHILQDFFISKSQPSATNSDLHTLQYHLIVKLRQRDTNFIFLRSISLLHFNQEQKKLHKIWLMYLGMFKWNKITAVGIHLKNYFHEM